jgi:hypothetical protein
MNNLLHFVREPKKESPNLFILPDILMSRYEHLKDTFFIRKVDEVDTGISSAKANTVSTILILESAFRKRAEDIYREQFNKVIMINLTINTRRINAVFFWHVYAYVEQALILEGLPVQIVDRLLVVDTRVKDRHVAEHIIEMNAPLKYKNMTSLVNDVVHDKVDTENLSHALDCISHPSLKKEAKIRHSALHHYNDSMANIDAKIYTINDEDTSTFSKNIRTESLQNKRTTIMTQRNAILDRLNCDNDCFVCHSAVTNPCVMKCCYNKVCFECIHKWLVRSTRCPLCNITTSGVFVVDTDKPPLEKHMLESHEFDFNAKKIDNLCILIRRLYKSNISVLIIAGSNKRAQYIRTSIAPITENCIVIKKNTPLEETNPKFTIYIQSLEKYPYPIEFKGISHIIFFDDTPKGFVSAVLHTSSDIKNTWTMQHVLSSN